MCLYSSADANEFWLNLNLYYLTEVSSHPS
ncbi:unnamed protein product [Debaryomyces fabryi]|nr:unnamed protein product [Debaryomyces fabryi]